jgi:hypothetical protein
MQNVDVIPDGRLAALTGTAYNGPAVAVLNTAQNTGPAVAPSSGTASVFMLIMTPRQPPGGTGLLKSICPIPG